MRHPSYHPDRGHPDRQSRVTHAQKMSLHIPLLYGTLKVVRSDVLTTSEQRLTADPASNATKRLSKLYHPTLTLTPQDHQTGSNLQSNLVKASQTKMALDLLVSGFREGHSTQSRLLKVDKGWRKTSQTIFAMLII
jgi:hypothetical protein